MYLRVTAHLDEVARSIRSIRVAPLAGETRCRLAKWNVSNICQRALIEKGYYFLKADFRSKLGKKMLAWNNWPTDPHPQRASILRNARLLAILPERIPLSGLASLGAL